MINTFPIGTVVCHAVYSVPTSLGSLAAYSGARANLFEMEATGIDVAAIDIFMDPTRLMPALEAAWGQRIRVCPVIDNSVQAQSGVSVDTMIGNTIFAVNAYSQMIKNNTNFTTAWHVGGLPVVVIYGTQQLTAANWAYIKVHCPGVYWLGADGGDLSYAVNWDAGYSFLPGNNLAAAYAFKPYLFGAMPQYTRAGVKYSQPPDGGTAFTAQIEAAIAAKAVGLSLQTWNDIYDGSAIFPDYVALTASLIHKYKSNV